jgi:hypothetical protein
MNSFLKENQKHRFRFVDLWADYVRTHHDKEWSRQQNLIINSCLQTATITKEQFLVMKQKKKIR